MNVTLAPLADPESVERTLVAMASAFEALYPSYRAWARQIAAEIGSGGRVLYAIQDGPTMVGSFLVRRLSNEAFKANSMLIVPDLRGRGYGTSTYRRFFAELPPAVRVVLTQCKEGNGAALRLLARSGFVEIGRLEHLVEQSNDNLVFARNVGDGPTSVDAIAIAREVYTSAGIKTFSPLPGA
jgi:RimJ/RimL family protein N-acetyltransferase